MSIERETAERLAHKDHIRSVLARTGGEVIHPDHYDLREAIRLAVIAALDHVADEMNAPKFSDRELPKLFACTDQIADQMFLKRVGL
jgi:hypothetical protein